MSGNVVPFEQGRERRNQRAYWLAYADGRGDEATGRSDYERGFMDAARIIAAGLERDREATNVKLDRFEQEGYDAGYADGFRAGRAVAS